MNGKNSNKISTETKIAYTYCRFLTMHIYIYKKLNVFT